MIVIIDYGLGNLNSIANMFKRVGVQAAISSDPEIIAAADKLVLPGVGAFDAGMRNLNESGLLPVLNKCVLERKILVLGLCLGMQLMARESEEGQIPGLGWLDASVVRFNIPDDQRQLKIPHMSWNTLEIQKAHPLFSEMVDEPRFYFVHSYHLLCHQTEDVLARTEYGYRFDSVVARGNIMGVQFHPEKSHKFGMRLLKNYAEVI
jgi:glutamine amidotransferase